MSTHNRASYLINLVPWDWKGEGILDEYENMKDCCYMHPSQMAKGY